MIRLLAVVLLLSACGSKPADKGPVDYSAPGGAFRATLPGNWRADEARVSDRLSAFFGPPDGPRPYSQSMAVYFHPASDPQTAARLYLASGDLSGPPTPITVGGLPGLEATSSGRERGLETKSTPTTTRTVVAWTEGGFYCLEQIRPTDDPPSPAFDEMLKTFRPGAKPQ